MEEKSWTGAVVAVEGPHKIVSTQLRLLPTSHQILILPALHHYIPAPTSFLDKFDAATYLRQVNAALHRRHSDAQQFLEGSTEEDRRLVFLDGGAASAQALCLKALMHHETAGDRVAAEEELARLSRRGLAGLAQASHARQHSASSTYSVADGDDDGESSDPSTRAMRAADALDRQTANLQVSNELDLTIRSHSRSSSLPLYGFFDSPKTEAAPFLVFGSSAGDATPRERRHHQAAQDPETPRFSVVQYDQHGEMPAIFGFEDFPTARSFASGAEGQQTGEASRTPRQGGSKPQLGAHPGHQQHSRAGSSATGTSTLSPMSDVFSIRSVGRVEYGRASLLDVRSSSVRKDSLVGGGVQAPGGGARGLSLHEPELSNPARFETGSSYNTNAGEAGRNTDNIIFSSIEEGPETAPRIATAAAGGSMSTLARAKSTTDRPRTIVVKKTRPVVKLQPVPSGKKRRWQQSKSTYVEDDGDLPRGKPRDGDYEPIFPRMEDLVLYLRSELTPQPLLESALNAMREEFIRKSSCLSTSSESSSEESTESFKSNQHTDEETVALTSPETSGPEHEPEEEEGTPKTAVKVASPTIPTSMDDYDPFAYINPVYGQGQPQPSKTSAPSVTILRPPTPAQTPPPSGPKLPGKDNPVEADSREITAEEYQAPHRTTEAAPEAEEEKEAVAELDGKICEIAVEPKQPPIAVQNAIRSVLSQHYPAEAKGYAPFQLPPLLERDGLWRPIFRGRKATSLPAGESGSSSGQQLKQILAVGLQKGVRREYSARVISQIEKFGTEPTGSARCTRLDFRYLLANTMQAFTSQPLTSQSSENPLANPHLLATLMLPHLETYLAMHADIRFLLLEYPPEHLSTVIAIQKLAGVDLVKIAQIVDAGSRERLPFRQVRGDAVSLYSQSNSSLSSQSAPDDDQSVRPYRSSSLDVSTTKANFLLTSSASDRDIADFVAAVWNVPVLGRPQTAPEASDHAARGHAFAALNGHGHPQMPSSSSATTTTTITRPRTSGGTSTRTGTSTSGSLSRSQSPPPLPESPRGQKSIKRKGKPAPLRPSALSAFPKATGAQSPLSPTANILSVLAPPAGALSPLSKTTTVSSSPPIGAPTTTTCTTAASTPTAEYTASTTTSTPTAAAAPSSSLSARASTLTEAAPPITERHGSNGSGSSNLAQARVSAVGMGGGQLHHRASASTMRTTSTAATGTTAAPTPVPHIARLKMPSKSSKLLGPSAPTTPSSIPSSVPRYLEAPPPIPPSIPPSIRTRRSFETDVVSVMTFDPAEDSDYDLEERRLMPIFGRKRPRSKTGTKKALRVLGMTA